MRPALNPPIRLSGPDYFSPGSLESLSDEELDRRVIDANRDLRRLTDERERRQRGRCGMPEITWQRGRPVVVERSKP